MERGIDFEIAISTYGERLEQAMSLADKLSVFANVLVVHQVPGRVDVEAPGSERIRYVQMCGRGVTKSRNEAIISCRAKYLWFLDDDVDVDVPKAKAFFESKFLSCMADADVLTFGVLNEYGGQRRIFSGKPKKHNRLSVLSVGTIEVVVDVQKVRSENISFPEDMGAGSTLPVADEPVFLAKCLSSGFGVAFYPVFFVSHPTVSSGGDLGDKRSAVSRGVAFQRIFGSFLGGGLLFLMYTKKLVTGGVGVTVWASCCRDGLLGLLGKY